MDGAAESEGFKNLVRKPRPERDELSTLAGALEKLPKPAVAAERPISDATNASAADVDALLLVKTAFVRQISIDKFI